jgi:hypothetical protein
MMRSVAGQIDAIVDQFDAGEACRANGLQTAVPDLAEPARTSAESFRRSSGMDELRRTSANTK